MVYWDYIGILEKIWKVLDSILGYIGIMEKTKENRDLCVLYGRQYGM